ncbi:MAG: hypothetical protein M1827_000333 [Pycnora praestabilis]|nr:MAG: hypothetical protein M1827_000333 [Pycnora praestabilis]
MGDYCAFFYAHVNGQMAPQVLHRVCYGSAKPALWQSRLLTIKPAVLHGFSRKQVRRCDYPAITHADGRTVRGAYVSGLTQGDLWRLDIFEGEEYIRKKVKVRLLNHVGDEDGKGNVEGEEVEAETYVWIAGEENLEEGEWDFGVFQREKMSRWIEEEGNEEYAGRPSIMEVDEAIRAGGGDPTGGRGMDGTITSQLETSKPEEMLGSAV